MEVSGQLHVPGALHPVSIGWETEWTPEPVWPLWITEKSVATAGNRTPAVQPIAVLYTD
jgi:hypothetical protein